MKILFLILFMILILITSTPSFAVERFSEDPLTSIFTHDVQMGELAIMWLGNHQKGSLEGYASAGFLIKTSNHIIAIDPSSLLFDDIDSLIRLDAIFITHDHGDHFDPDTTIAMQTKTGSFVIADPTSASMLSGKIPEDKLIVIESNEQMTISEITVDAFAAEHPTETPLIYVIEFDGFRIFHGSDSAFVEDLKKIESPVDIAFVPAGDPSPTASPSDAFEMTKATQSSIVVPMHGSPEQIEMFRDLVDMSDQKTEVIIPKPLEMIMPSFLKIEEPKIPDWIRNNARWWSNGQISDQTFLSGIQYLIDQGIMIVPKTEVTIEVALPSLPSWVKDTAGWWANGQVTDDDFLNGIKYLVEHGIIRL